MRDGWSFALLLAIVWECLSVQAAAPPPPLSPEESMKRMEIVSPYVVELVASEPDVVDPVAFTWDADGRLFVAEMGDYPAREGGGRIKLLEDRDGDGRMDRHVVFADQLPFPNGLLPYRNGLLVTAAPDILFLRDDDGDGRADHREVILTGFGQGNQQLKVNGLAWSYDGWVYAANGRNGGSITSPKIPGQAPVSIDRHDLRFRPDTGEVEAVAGFSQFGNAFDSFGSRFSNWNTIPFRHVLFPLDVALRHPLLPPEVESEVLDDPIQQNRVFPRSDRPATFNREPAGYFNASCGLSFDKGGLFPPGEAGSAFVCEPLFNVVHRRRLERHGATFKASRPPQEQEREFLASSDPWFRPVFTGTGPDGSLHVADFYRRWVEHPDFVRPDLRGSVDWSEGNDRGRIYRVRPVDSSPFPVVKLSSLSSTQLVELLAHPNGWRREAALRLLKEKDDRSIVPTLRETLTRNPEALARLAALSLLVSWKEPFETVEKSLRDESPDVRRWLVHFARTSQGASGIVERVCHGPMDADPSVRFELALAAEYLPTEKRVPFLRSILAAAPSDPWVDRAVLCVTDDAARGLLSAMIEEEKFDDREMRILRDIAGIVGRGRFDSDLSLLQSTSRNPSNADEKSWVVLASWLAGIVETKQPMPTTVAGFPLADWMDAARNEASSRQKESLGLTSIIAVLAHDPSAEATGILIDKLSEQKSSDLTRACLRSLRGRQDPAVVEGLLHAWPAASPSMKREMFEILASRSSHFSKITEAIETGVMGEADLSPDDRQMLVERSPAEWKERLTQLIKPASSADRSSLLATIQGQLPPKGNSVAGKEVFVKNCAGCHRSGEVGSRVGPDLAGMRSKSREQLLEDILDPNRQVLPDYSAFSVLTFEGMTISGLLVAESPTSIVLRKAEGISETISRKDVEEMRATGKSLMPEGFEQTLHPAQIADLISYLRQEP